MTASPGDPGPQPQPQPQSQPQSQPSRRRRLLILAICCSSLVIVALDNTIVNIALPSIQRDLHASVSGLQWTVDAYTLVLASFLMLAGSTADRLGRRRVFQTRRAAVPGASPLFSVAPSPGWRVAFRVLQAARGAPAQPAAIPVLPHRVHTHPGRGPG